MKGTLEWVSWEVFKGKKGVEVALEMALNNRVHMRFSEDLDPNTTTVTLNVQFCSGQDNSAIFGHLSSTQSYIVACQITHAST